MPGRTPRRSASPSSPSSTTQSTGPSDRSPGVSGLASPADGPAAATGLELLGQVGMVAIRAADLRPAAGPRLGKDGRTALTVARPGRIATGDLVVFLKPVA